jgi:hypothetical protein
MQNKELNDLLAANILNVIRLFNDIHGVTVQKVNVYAVTDVTSDVPKSTNYGIAVNMTDNSLPNTLPV